jgi:hypothetical protein
MMNKNIILGFIAAIALSGCGKAEQMFQSSVSGFTTRCIEGTRYVLMDSNRGVAITPLVDTNGNPKGCDK